MFNINVTWNILSANYFTSLKRICNLLSMPDNLLRTSSLFIFKQEKIIIAFQYFFPISEVIKNSNRLQAFSSRQNKVMQVTLQICVKSCKREFFHFIIYFTTDTVTESAAMTTKFYK